MSNSRYTQSRQIVDSIILGDIKTLMDRVEAVDSRQEANKLDTNILKNNNFIIGVLFGFVLGVTILSVALIALTVVSNG